MAQELKKDIKILSLDGGGVRGLSSLLILKRLMYSLGSAMTPEREDLEPWQYFDLIGGTSTGGIIAIMLGRLRMSVDECIAEYEKLSAFVFREKKVGKPELFRAKKLEEAVKGVIRKKLGEDMEDAPLLDPLKEECCKTLVLTLPSRHPNTVQATYLRTYRSKTAEPLPCTIWQACRATSAAPTFFKPIKFGVPARAFVDAGLGFNNPGKAIRREAAAIWGDRTGELDWSRIGSFVSLGTGHPGVSRLDEGNWSGDMLKRAGVPLDAVKAMKAIVTDCDKTAYELEKEFSGLPGVFHRFNVEQGLQGVELFDYEKVEDITVDTDAYLTRREDDVRRCVLSMAALGGEVRESRAVVALAVAELPYGQRQLLLKEDLDRLDVDEVLFKNARKTFERHRKFEQTAGIDYLFDMLVLADILDRQGRDILSAWRTRQSQHPPPSSTAHARPHRTLVTPEMKESLALAAASRTHAAVDAQERANEKILVAHRLYRDLLRGQNQVFGPESLDALWTAHRLAGTARLLGLCTEAAWFYKLASDGRLRELGYRDKGFQRSANAGKGLALAGFTVTAGRQPRLYGV